MTKLSLGVIRKDKELLLMPILAAVVTVLVFISMVLPLMFIPASGILTPVIGIGFYFVASVVIVYFQVATIAIAHIRLSGGNPKLGDGLKVANANLGKIIIWAIILAIVSWIIRAIRQRGGLAGQIIAWIGGAAWSLVTFFVIPVMIYEGKGVGASMKKSLKLFKRTWGETMVSGFMLGIIFFLLMLPGIIMIIIGAVTLDAGAPLLSYALIITGIIYAVIIACMQFAAQGVLVSALYIYATTGQIPNDFRGASFGGQPRADMGYERTRYEAPPGYQPPQQDYPGSYEDWQAQQNYQQSEHSDGYNDDDDYREHKVYWNDQDDD